MELTWELDVMDIGALRFLVNVGSVSKGYISTLPSNKTVPAPFYSLR